MSTGERDEVIRTPFRELAERISAARDPDDVYAVVAQHAVALIDGCDHAAVSLLDKGRMRTAAATDDVALLLDDLQRETGDGPCLDAIRDEGWEHHRDVHHSDTPFTRAVRERTPVHTMLGFRLIQGDEKRGALNLFSDEPDAFGDGVAEQAAILAAFAGVAAANAARRREVQQLNEALETNREIAKAIGIIMASQNVGDDEAYERLMQASQRLHRKLRDVAADVVAVNRRK